MIYFTQDTLTKAIKIGYSKDTKKRQAGLQSASSSPLVLLGDIQGGLEHEADLHRRFAEHRLHGEWFKGDILHAVLAIIAEEAASPRPTTTNVIVAGDSEQDFWPTDARQMAERGRLEAAVTLALEEIHTKTPIAWVIIGGDRQIETFAERWAVRNKVRVYPYYPNWRRYGRGAPARAGKQMLRARFDPKVLLVFPGVKASPSTRALIRQAEKARIEVVVKERPAETPQVPSQG